MTTDKNYSRKTDQTRRELDHEQRLDMVQKWTSLGKSERQIAEIIGCSKTTVHEDLKLLRQQARTNISKYIDEYLPHEHQRALNGLDQVLEGLYTSYENSRSERDKQSALSQIRDTLTLRLETVCNSGMIQRAIDYVTLYKVQQQTTEIKQEPQGTTT